MQALLLASQIQPRAPARFDFPSSSNGLSQQQLTAILLAQHEQQQLYIDSLQQQERQRVLTMDLQTNNALQTMALMHHGADNTTTMRDDGGRVDTLISLLRQQDSVTTNDAAQHLPKPQQADSFAAPRTVNTIRKTAINKITLQDQQQEEFKDDKAFASQRLLVQQQQNALTIPPSCDGPVVPHWTCRPAFPLAVDEDPNWLSEFHCFVRSELVELFRAGTPMVQQRNFAIQVDQVGMRCRFCAHAKTRAGRSSAFPSSLRQIYQSFTMMLRDHFSKCEAIPAPLLQRFLALKDKPAQGATDSKRYWIYSAMKLGMIDDTERGKGMRITEASRALGNETAPFGTNSVCRWDDESYAAIPLILPSDRALVSEFLYLLISQVQPVRLQESECIGNRRSLRVGLPGFGCRSCCERRRLGMCRVFPARRRTLPGKVADMYDHLSRCHLCPTNIKEQLARLSYQFDEHAQAELEKGSDFYDRMWSRLGHDSPSA